MGVGVDVVAVGGISSRGFEGMRKWAAQENDSSAWGGWSGGRCWRSCTTLLTWQGKVIIIAREVVVLA